MLASSMLATLPIIRRGRPRTAFTLVELLVVIAIISLLVGILLPALSHARATSKLSACLSNLREVSLAIQAYSVANEGAIPRGPATPLPYDSSQTWSQWATNQLWIGSLDAADGLGVLLSHDLRQPKVLFCPADDSNDPGDELAKLEQHRPEDAFGSYLYRQLDQTSRDRFDDLGRNDAGLPARALALDANSLDSGTLRRTNHGAQKVNIVYLDTHAQTVPNKNDVFSLRASDYAGFPGSVERRLNQIMVSADFAEHGNPLEAPTLP